MENYKKSNFSDLQIAKLVKTFGSLMQISINKAGNIKVVDQTESGKTNWRGKMITGFWTLLKRNNNTYLWRHHDGWGYAYPLNMRGRKRVGKWHSSYTIDNSTFDTFDEALEYFVKYLAKYRQIEVK